jgi:hypothetical protein
MSEGDTERMVGFPTVGPQVSTDHSAVLPGRLVWFVIFLSLLVGTVTPISAADSAEKRFAFALPPAPAAMLSSPSNSGGLEFVNDPPLGSVFLDLQRAEGTSPANPAVELGVFTGRIILWDEITPYGQINPTANTSYSYTLQIP